MWNEESAEEKMKLYQDDFDLIRQYIQNLCGISINQEKKYLVTQRLGELLKEQGCKSFQEFANILSLSVPEYLRDQIISAITTNETSFFRDKHPFDNFTNHILPKLCQLGISRKNRTWNRKGAQISILCAGASTGQEPYSLSMLIKDYLNFHSALPIDFTDFSIVAVDVSSKVLSKAISGEYNDLEIEKGLSEAQKLAYFDRSKTRLGYTWRVKDEIRRIIEFKNVNLIQPFTYLGGFDIIFCRNILIYFEESTKRSILKQFHYMLTDEGYLILGATENLYGMEDLFESFYVGKTILYKKNPSTKTTPAVNLF